METTVNWRPDILGTGFEAATFELHSDKEGKVITTLIRHTPTTDSTLTNNAPPPHAPVSTNTSNAATAHTTHTTPTTNTTTQTTPLPEFAFLALHGWNDYFYQVQLARHISSIGGHFYALDLRKYGRSHLHGQSWGYISDLSDYDEELHVALDTIYHEHGYAIPLILYGHSTGGLTAALWAHRHPGALTGLILNSPWLELQGAVATRLAGQGAIDRLARLAPNAVIPIPDSDFYHRTLTGNHLDADNLPANAHTDPFFTTGWQPDENLRGPGLFDVRAGWFNAILAGHRAVAEGLAIDAPILVLTSAKSITSNTWNNDFLAGDSVLTVENIWKRVPFLGRIVTLEKLEGAIHDVTFSRRSVREQAFASMTGFIHSAIPGSPSYTRHVV